MKHKTLGLGTVMRYEEDKVVILFDESGYKSVVAKYVIENKLVELQ